MTTALILFALGCAGCVVFGLYWLRQAFRRNSRRHWD